MSDAKINIHFPGELWAMAPEHLSAFAARIEAAKIDDAGDDKKEKIGYENKNGVAHIPISGIMLKNVPDWFGGFGISAASTVEIRKALADAIEDDDVKTIQLDVDSPGGTVSGVDDLAQDVKAANGLKPVVAHVDDLMASAAYWAAGQAGRVTATRLSHIGSIGVYTVLVDSSKALEDSGIKVRVVSTHELKGAGVPGSEITEKQIEDVQRNVDAIGAMFKAAVAEARGMKAGEINKVATGQVWLAEEAMSLGLIDAVINREGAKPEDEPEDEPEQQEESPDDGDQEEEAMADKTNAPASEHPDRGAEGFKAARKMLCRQYADRVTAENRSSVEEYGDFCGSDLDKFESYLKSLPNATRSEQVGETPEAKEPQAKQVDPASKAVCRVFGISVSDYEKFGSIESATCDGFIITNDGAIVRPEEL